MGIHNEMQAFATIEEENVVLGAQLQWKRFRFGFPDQGNGRQNNPHGWNWSRWVVTLQRIALPDQPPFATFLADFESVSYGRWTGDHTPWLFSLTLMAGETPLRQFNLGRALLYCATTARTLQGPIPTPELGPFPELYFQQIDRVRLNGGGNQESC